MKPSLFERLVASSPLPANQILCAAEEFIPSGYHHDLVCVGTNLQSFETQTQNGLDHPLSSYSLIVPAVMKSHQGYFEGSKRMGPRTIDNIGKVYAKVFSAPKASLEAQAAAINSLRERAGLAFIVMADSNHIEGWFPIAAMSMRVSSFIKEAIALGASPSASIECHPYALPGGLNSRGHRQNVIYADPRVISLMRRDAAIPPTLRAYSNKWQVARVNGHEKRKQRKTLTSDRKRRLR